MRRFITATIGSFFVLTLLAGPGWGQFRRVQRTSFGRVTTATPGGSGLLIPSPRISHAAMQLANYYGTSPANAMLASQLGYYPSALSNPYFAAGYNPYALNNPYLNPYAYSNPYMPSYSSPYSYANLYMPSYSNPYSYASPYTPGTYGYGGASYSAGYAQTPGYAAASPYSGIPNYTPPSASQPKQEPLLAALGVPNEDSSVKWPSALRTMSPQQKQELLDPLEAQLQIIAKQGAAGKANPATLKEAKRSVDQLFGWLRTHRLDMAEGSFKEARRFLERIDGTLDGMSKAY